MTTRDFHKIAKDMIRLQCSAHLISDNQSAIFFLRRIGFQQFPYQQQIGSAQIARQLLLFASLDEDAFFENRFKNRFGLSVADFTSWSLALVTFCLVEPRHSFKPSYFFSVSHAFQEGSLECFLEAISVTRDQLFESVSKKYLKDIGARNYFEQAVFFERPLMFQPRVRRADSTYIFFHPMHVHQALRDFVYDNLRSLDASLFMNKFGEHFSRYIRRVLDYSDCKVETEKDLWKRFGCRGQSIVDFAVEEEKAIILFEVKGVEASNTVKTTPSPTILGSALKDSLMKALGQGQESARIYKDNGASGTKQFWQIVVTYKQLHMATGRVIEACLDSSDLNRIMSDQNGVSHFDLESVFVMTVDELEFLVEAIKRKDTTFDDFFTFVQDQERNPKTRKFVVDQHLKARGYSMPPSFLREKMKEVFIQFESALKPLE
jgi:hypothetical protein